MRRLLAITFFLVCAGALPSCSALGLDNLPQADCVRGGGGQMGDAFCASLAMRVPPPDDCHTWQCNGQSRHCEILPRDDDGDGAPAMMCAAGATPDCNDMDAMDAPGGTETCDGRDQNCDGVPDDVAIVTSENRSSLTTINASPDQLALAYQPDADEVYLLARYTNAFDAVTIGTTATPNMLAFSQMGSGTVVPQQADGALAALGGSAYAIAVRRTVTVGCQQWALFRAASATSAVTLRAADESLLPACPTSGTQQVTAPAIAAHGNGASPGETLLVAWLAGADDARSCGAASPLPVTISAAAFDDRSAAHDRMGTEVITLGNSVGDGPPTVLALSDAFLVAYPRADVTIAVHLVTVDPTTLHVTVAAATPEYSEPAGAMTPQGVGLALGPTTSGATSIALSYYQGCGGSNPITVRLLTRNGTALTASSTPATGLGSGLARSHLVVTYQPRASEWLVGWRNAAGLSVQRLFEDGAAEGAPFDVAMSASVSAFVVEPLATGPLYRAVVVDGTSLNQVTFGCAAAAP